MKTRCKAVAQYTLDGKFIRVFESAAEAARSVFGKVKLDSNITRCCMGKANVIHDYRWVYESDMDRAEEIFKSHEIRRRYKRYTEQEIIEEAKKYRTKAEFAKKALYYNHAAYRLGIMDKLQFERLDNPFKDKIYCIYAYEFKETHSVYVGLTWRKEGRDEEHRTDERNQTWKHAHKYNISIPDPKYLLEGLTQEQAKINEDNYKKDYAAKGWNVLNKAKTGINSSSVGSACRRHTVKELRQCIGQCSTRDEMLKRFKKVYDYACREGLLGELECLDRKTKAKGTLTKDYCFNVASKFDTVREFMEKERVVYQVSCRNGWYGEYTWLSREKERGINVAISTEFSDIEEWNIVASNTLRNIFGFLGVSGCSMRDLQKSAQKHGYYAFRLSE